ncbi:MAG: hypothetical protein J6Z50_01700 [Fibrobacterales bacterium]|nr:hypothetical protein [Fibrobacterales bacterium]MBP5187822.1 hypothetical protein [Fibrobacterales bacterium]
MIDLLVAGSGAAPVLLLERVSWLLGLSGRRAVALWADLEAGPERAPAPEREPAEGEELPAYDAIFAELERRKSGSPAAEENISAENADGKELLPLTPLLQELVQGAELQGEVELVVPDSFPLKERARRAWVRFLMGDPDGDEPFRAPPGSEVSLKRGWEGLVGALREKHAEARLAGCALVSAERAFSEVEERELWRATLKTPSGERTVECGELAVAGAEGPAGAWTLSSGDGFAETAGAADALARTLAERLSLEA